MAFFSSSKPGSWTSRFYEILRPAPHPLAIQFSNSQSRFRHKAGEIWRHALTTSVYRDLAGENDLLASKASHTCYAWRRFVRVECLGLSGLLFYEIRLLPAVDSRAVNTGGYECGLSLENVFGSSSDISDEGLDLDDLLDIVHAKVVYFPAYACTSFVIGQAMTAFFRGQPSLRPRPSREGFSVPSEESLKSAVNIPSENAKDAGEAHLLRVVDVDSEGDLPLSYSWQLICHDLGELDELSMDLDDPHRPLCIRSSSVSPDAIDYPDEDEDKDDGNTTVSTIESIGPCTPPRSNMAEPRGAHVEGQDTDVTASLIGSVGVLDLPMDPTISKSKSKNSSERTPTFLSSGTFCLSVYDDLASFLDISY